MTRYVLSQVIRSLRSRKCPKVRWGGGGTPRRTEHRDRALPLVLGWDADVPGSEFPGPGAAAGSAHPRWPAHGGRGKCLPRTLHRTGRVPVRGLLGLPVTSRTLIHRIRPFEDSQAGLFPGLPGLGPLPPAKPSAQSRASPALRASSHL